MDAVSKREKPQLDLDALDIQGLKALVLAKQSELDSRNTEIESLKLLILKLKRMHFGPRSEKFSGDIEQLELQLEDLEVNQGAAEPLPIQPATVALNIQVQRKPVRRALPAELPRETETIAPKQDACPDCGGTLRRLGEDVSEMLEYVPARFKVLRTVRPKLSCACCSRILQEPAPNRPIDRVAGRSWPSGACAGVEVYRSFAALSSVGDLSARGRGIGPLDAGRLGRRSKPHASAVSRCAAAIRVQCGEGTWRRCAGSGACAWQGKDEDRAVVDVRSRRSSRRQSGGFGGLVCLLAGSQG